MLSEGNDSDRLQQTLWPDHKIHLIDTKNGKCGRAPRIMTIFRSTIRKVSRKTS